MDVDHVDDESVVVSIWSNLQPPPPAANDVLQLQEEPIPAIQQEDAGPAYNNPLVRVTGLQDIGPLPADRYTKDNIGQGSCLYHAVNDGLKALGSLYSND